MTINSHIYNFSPVQIEKIVVLIIKWCINRFGLNKRSKKDLIIHLEYDDSDGDTYADFDVIKEGRIITIYMDVNLTFKHLITSILHEFQHYLQKWSNYWPLYKKFGYKNHPYEIEARKIERKNFDKCWNDVRIGIEKIVGR